MEFRNYEQPGRDTVDDFYHLNHKYQTFEFASARKDHYSALSRERMGIWEACELLDNLVDDSDPDTELSQLEHLLQTAEAARRDGRPDWFVVTALIHDLGKILYRYGEPQWAIVGDTFPLGCPFDDAIIYSDYFIDNPDSRNNAYNQGTGIYQPNIGLDNVTMSWGHDEYLYMVTRPYLPDEALFIIRYHSFYAAHTEGAYGYLLNPRDIELMALVKTFSQYDLYSKGDQPPDVEQLKPYYTALIARFFPQTLNW